MEREDQEGECRRPSESQGAEEETVDGEATGEDWGPRVGLGDTSCKVRDEARRWRASGRGRKDRVGRRLDGKASPTETGLGEQWSTEKLGRVGQAGETGEMQT